MKTTGEAVGRQLKALFLACVLVLLTTLALAQDSFVTNAIQLCQVSYSGSYSMYVPDTPWSWRGFSFGIPIWLDCTESNLPCAALFLGTTNIQYNGVSVNVAMPTLVRDVLTGVTTISAPGATDIIAQVPAPDGWYPGLWSEDRGVVWMWNQWTNCPDCWGEAAGGIIDPTVTLPVLLANAADYDAYASNVAAQAEVQCQTSDDASVGLTLAAMAMDDDEGDPCTITDESAPFSVVSLTPDGSGNMVLTWQSCADHIYVVQSESSLTPAPSWADVAWMFGTDQQTSWTDTNAVGLTQNFYQVVRGNPTNTNNGISYGWAVTYGLDPLDPNLASETSTNPWAHGLTNLQVYQNPSVLIADNYSTVGDRIPDWWKVTYGFSLTDRTVAGADPDGDGLINLAEYLLGTNPNVFDPPLDMIVNGDTAYTSSLTISIQPTTNYPNIRVSTDPLMSNATVVAISGGSASYTLPDNGDGLYDLYLQYADAGGRPHSVVLTKPVTLDRLVPVVYITSPASNAVLDQAFITLQAVAADPDPIAPDEFRPLNIWINGQPFWNRAGTNIVIEQFPVPAGTNSFTVTIQAVDLAGNTNQATQTWVVNTSAATNAPALTNIDLIADQGPGASGAITVPQTSPFWLQGNVDNANAIVTATVNGGAPMRMTVVGNQFGQSLPLVYGTNAVALIASDAAGNTMTNLYTVISSGRFQVAITNLDFGAFANGRSNIISGYVSGSLDAGLPTSANLISISVNGISATVSWDQMDANGNVPFTTDSSVPSPAWGDAFEPIDIQTTWADGEEFTTPAGLQNGYEVIAKGSKIDSFLGLPDISGAVRTVNTVCLPEWFVGVGEDIQTNVVDLTGGDWVTVTPYYEYRDGIGCTAHPETDSSIWDSWSAFSQGSSYTDYARSLSFGTELRHEFAIDQYGNEWEFVWPDVTTASLTFRAPVQYLPNTVVILTFEGVNYTRPDGMPLDLSQIQYLGQEPVSNDASSVSYLITVNGGQTYTIDQDSFQWPSFTTHSIQQDSGVTDFITDTMHSLSWTNFHNAKPEIIGPTNLYVYCNASPSSGVFYVTNAIPARSVSWSVTSGSDRVQINGTTGVATPTDANHASRSLNDVTIGAAVTFRGGQQTILTKNITVRKPGAFGPPDIKPGSSRHGFPVDLDVYYAVWDQLCAPFPPQLIAGTPVSESFPNGNAGSAVDNFIRADGTAHDAIAIPLSKGDNGAITYLQVLIADCATVTNNITTDPLDNNATITQSGPCH